MERLQISILKNYNSVERFTFHGNLTPVSTTTILPLAFWHYAVSSEVLLVVPNCPNQMLHVAPNLQISESLSK